MVGRTTRVISLLAIALVSLLSSLAPAQAVTFYSLTFSTSRTQEQNSPGVTMTLTVTGALTGQPYSFVFTVFDPTNSKSNATRATSAPGATFSFTLTYPSDFTGGSIKYVGQYSVNVAQTAPAVSSSVAAGHFAVGLTDRPIYQRTLPVSVKADGYRANETLTVNITHQAVPAPNFPTLINADPAGNLVFSWTTDPDLPTGNYTVTVTGTNTVKLIRDSQNFIIYPTNVTVNQINAPISLMRTQTAQFNFSASYLGSGAVQSGSAVLIVRQPDSTSQTLTATFDPASGLFIATYRAPFTGLQGDWTVTLRRDSLDDGYGNRGPDSPPPPTTFTVTPASLSVNLTFTAGSITAGNVVGIYSTITTPDGSLFTSGTVSAFVSPPGRQLGNEVNLLYDARQTKWVGSYTVQNSDPSGVWVVQVSASDPYGDSGSGSKSSNITVASTPGQGSTITIWFLTVLAAIGAGLAAGVFVFRRKRTLSHHLHVDLQAVGEEASRVKSQEFFKSVKEQLEKQRDDKGS